MLKFKKASADEVRAKRKDHVKDLSSGTAVLKGFKAPPSWNDDTRSAKFIMSSESVDRYRDIVVQGGIDTTAFEKNPQGLLFHNSRSWPIGLWSDITKVLTGRPKRLEGVLNFLPEGTDEDADRAARHVKAGSMRTVSIGFIPDWSDVDFILDEDDDWTGGFRFNKCELIECSLVPVPAQPDAMVKDAGGDFQLARDLIEDILDTYTKTPEGLLVPLDAYGAKHRELSGNRSSIVVEKALLPTVKHVERSALAIKANTDEEAREYVGAKVAFDPAHPENKGSPFDDVLAKATGEVIGSWIVDDGEFKGVHGLAVEFLTNDYSGMFRGIKAERFVLVKAAESDEPDEEHKAIDETDGLSEEAVAGLIERGMVFLTERKVGDKTLSGAIIAKSFEEAEEIAAARGLGEKVVGEKVATIDKAVEVEQEPEPKDSASTEVQQLSVKLNVTTDIAETTKQIEALESITDRVIAKIGKIFGFHKAPAATERRDPELTVEGDEKTPPTEAEIAELKARAAATRARLIAKGMIAAE
ncbi:hypothetical protein ShzoTeo12_11320 [Shinella zoogloeoides]|nr:hypothetical protein ShzoTeo12_11320 [Shinella zoogloeoides]